MTSAPRTPSWYAANGPASTWVQSRTLIPSNGRIRVFLRLSDGVEDLAAGLDRLGRDENDGEHARRGPPVHPVVDGAALDHHVSGLQVDDRVIQLHVDLAGHHDDVVDRVRPVVAGG